VKGGRGRDVIARGGKLRTVYENYVIFSKPGWGPRMGKGGGALIVLKIWGGGRVSFNG